MIILFGRRESACREKGGKSPRAERGVGRKGGRKKRGEGEERERVGRRESARVRERQRQRETIATRDNINIVRTRSIFLVINYGIAVNAKEMRVEGSKKSHVNLQFCSNLGDLYLYRIAFQSYSSSFAIFFGVWFRLPNIF